MSWSQVFDKLLSRVDIKFPFIMHSIFLISLLSIIPLILVYGPTELLNEIVYWEKLKTPFKYLLPFFLIALIFELAYWGTKIAERKTKSKRVNRLSPKQQEVLNSFIENNTQTREDLGKTSAVLSLEKMGILRHMANEIGERAAYFLEDWYYNYLRKHHKKMNQE